MTVAAASLAVLARTPADGECLVDLLAAFVVVGATGGEDLPAMLSIVIWATWTLHAALVVAWAG